MATVLITGANRGLGLEFCRQYAAAGWEVLACCRKPGTAQDLQALAGQFDSIEIFALDVADFKRIDALSRELAERRINVLLNNAGIYGDSREHGFGNLDYGAWTETLRINLQAPVKMTEAFLPQIGRSDRKLVVAISSLMGSIADNGSGGSLLYCSSKAGLNAAMKSLALMLEHQAIGVLIFHPGWVKTDMGGANALIEAGESIAGMRSIIDRFTLQQTGSFIKYDGTPLPW